MTKQEVNDLLGPESWETHSVVSRSDETCFYQEDHTILPGPQIVVKFVGGLVELKVYASRDFADAYEELIDKIKAAIGSPPPPGMPVPTVESAPCDPPARAPEATLRP